MKKGKREGSGSDGTDVGRASGKMVAVRKCVDQAMSGEGNALVIDSYKDVTKTRLVRSLETYSEAKNAPFLSARCRHRDSMKPYVPFVGVVTRYLEDSDVNGTLIGETIKSLPYEMGGVLPILKRFRSDWGGYDFLRKDVAISEIGKSSDIVFEGFSRLLIAIAEETPLMLCLEDIHWADTSSIKLSHYMVRSIRDSRIFFYLTYDSQKLSGRGGIVTDTIYAMEREERATRLTLQGVTLPESPELASSFLELEGVSEEVTGEFHGKESEEAMGVEVSKRETPEVHREPIADRINKLDEETSGVLRYAAVVGYVVDTKILGCATQIDDTSLRAALDRLEGTGLIEQDKRGMDKYKFNAEAYEIVYSQLHLKVRQQAHRRVGLCIEKHYDTDVDEVIHDLALHFINAMEHEKTVEYATKAGDCAAKIFAPHEALTYYKIALDVLERLNKDPKRDKRRIAKKIAVLKRLGNTCYIVGEWDSAIDYNKQLIVLGKKESDEKSIAEAQFHLGQIFQERGQLDEALQALEAGLEIATKSHDTSLTAECHRLIGKVFWKRGHLDDAVDSISKGIGLAEEAGDKSLLGKMYGNMGVAYLEKGDYGLAMDYLQRSIEILEDANDLLELTNTYNNIGCVYGRTKDYEKALEYYEKQIEIAKRIGDIRLEGFGLVNSAEELAEIGDKGRFGEAMERCKRSLQIFEKLGDKRMIAGSHNIFGMILAKLEEWDKTTEHFEESIRLMEEADMPYELADTLFEFGRIYKGKGDAPQAIEQLTKAKDIWEGIGNMAMAEEAAKLLEELGALKVIGPKDDLNKEH
ncbi:MAG: tetratricopeptide repeat protein [Thermoplasmata archaeon]|nr:tetratricopeptide repeat protein [Thermoplasmata archaeon]